MPWKNWLSHFFMTFSNLLSSNHCRPPHTHNFCRSTHEYKVSEKQFGKYCYTHNSQDYLKPSVFLKRKIDYIQKENTLHSQTVGWFFLNSHFMFNIWFQKSYGCEWLRFLSISGNVGGLIRPWSQLLKKNGPHSTYRSFNERSNIPHSWGDCHQHVAFLLSSK